MSCFKKGLSLSAALLAGALLLTACGGAPASSASSVPASSVASSEAAEQPEEPAMKYTQTPTVPTETYKEEADFADFLSKADNPFLKQDIAFILSVLLFCSRLFRFV